MAGFNVRRILLRILPALACLLFYRGSCAAASSPLGEYDDANGGTAAPATSPPPTASPTTSSPTPYVQRPNVLMIVTDQHRYDVLGVVQRLRTDYVGKVKVRTPNLDKLAARGTLFSTAYCASPTCGPSRASLKTGCTVQRTGITRNPLMYTKYQTRMDFIREKVLALETFEQVLSDKFDYHVEVKCRSFSTGIRQCPLPCS